MYSHKKLFLIVSSMLSLLWASDCMSDTLRLVRPKQQSIPQPESMPSAPSNDNQRDLNAGNSHSLPSYDTDSAEVMQNTDAGQNADNRGSDTANDVEQQSEGSYTAGNDSPKKSNDVIDNKELDDSAEFDTINSLSLINTPPTKLAKDDQPMIMPLSYENNGDYDFLEGRWQFDKDFTDEKGNKVKAEFEFEADGAGRIYLKNSKNEGFEGRTKAEMEGDVLKIRTGSINNAEGKKAYSPLYIECKKVKDSLVCDGSDGWHNWGNEQLIAVDDRAFDSIRRTEELNDQYAASEKNDDSAEQGDGNDDDNGEYASQDDSADITEESSDTGAEAANALAELGEGVELPAMLTENTQKASVNKNNKSNPLEGGWRFSQNLVRKGDGANIGLEFHFDKEGNGYSVIKDSVYGDSKANASMAVMKDGSYRVKTDSYKGNKLYYPTFMQCKPNAKKELNCNVSNGWVHLENGQLVSLESLNKSESEYEEIVMQQSDDLQQSEDLGVSEGGEQSSNQENSQQQDDGSASVPSASSDSTASSGNEQSTDDLLAGLSDLDAGGQASNSDSEGLSTEDMLANLSESGSAAGSNSSFGASGSSEGQNSSASSANASRSSGASSASASRSSGKQNSSASSGKRASGSSFGQSASGKKSSEYLSIPKNKNTFEFLKGRWLCNSGLVNDSDTPIVFEFSFDSNGKGTGIVRDEKGLYYSTIKASYDRHHNLVVNTSDFYNKKTNKNYEGQAIVCKSVKGRALCSGRNIHSNTRWNNTTFERVK